MNRPISMGRFVSIVLASMTGLLVTSSANAGVPTYSDECDQGQRRQLAEAWAETQRMLRESAASLSKLAEEERSTSPRYLEYMKTYNAADYSKFAEGFAKAAAKADDPNFSFRIVCKAYESAATNLNCRDAMACVPNQNIEEIYLTAAASNTSSDVFWTTFGGYPRPVRGCTASYHYEPMSQILLHEFTHFNAVLGTKDCYSGNCPSLSLVDRAFTYDGFASHRLPDPGETQQCYIPMSGRPLVQQFESGEKEVKPGYSATVEAYCTTYDGPKAIAVSGGWQLGSDDMRVYRSRRSNELGWAVTARNTSTTATSKMKAYVNCLFNAPNAKVTTAAPDPKSLRLTEQNPYTWNDAYQGPCDPAAKGISHGFEVTAPDGSYAPNFDLWSDTPQVRRTPGKQDILVKGYHYCLTGVEAEQWVATVNWSKNVDYPSNKLLEYSRVPDMVVVSLGFSMGNRTSTVVPMPKLLYSTRKSRSAESWYDPGASSSQHFSLLEPSIPAGTTLRDLQQIGLRMTWLKFFTDEPSNLQMCVQECSMQTQSDLKMCQSYLDCYTAYSCDPDSCGSPDDVCGVNHIGGGTAAKGIADAVYQCVEAGGPGAPPVSTSCLQSWRSTVCGLQCTGQTQGDLKTCETYLDCYLTNNCGPFSTCADQDALCGVNRLGGGTAGKAIADQVYSCLGCK